MSTTEFSFSRSARPSSPVPLTVPAALWIVGNSLLPVEPFVAVVVNAIAAIVFLGSSLCIRSVMRRYDADIARIFLALFVGAIITAVGFYRVAYEARKPTIAIDSEFVDQMEVRTRTDLRPSASGVRTLPVSLVAATDRRGWSGSADGTVLLLWEGEESIVLADRTERLIPVRGDTIVIAPDSFSPEAGVVWLEPDAMALHPNEGWIPSVRRVARDTVRRRFDRLERDTRGLMVALLLGDRGGVDPETYRKVRMSGAAHVLALSGMHLGVLGVLLGALLSKVMPPRAATVTVAVVLGGYVWIAGWIPSLLRAIAMVIVVTVSRLVSIRITAPMILGSSVLLLSLVYPAILTEIGFLYSVLALIGLMFATPRISAGLSEILPRAVSVYIGASLGALLLTSPLSLAFFGVIYPGGIVMAGVLSLVVTVMMWIGIVFAMIGSVPGIGGAVGAVLETVVSMFAWLAEAGSRIPAFSLDSIPLSGVIIGAFGLLACTVGGVLLLRRHHDAILQKRKAYIGESQFHF